MNYIQELFTLFRNKALNSLGVERDIYQLIKDGDVGAAIALMQDREDEVDIALSEYKPELHKVMSRPNKFRKNKKPYISEKLPRNRQQFINEVELFFLLGKPIKWEKKAGDDGVYQMFLDFINETRFNVTMRKVKRLAGSETESAKLYHLYRNEKNEAEVKVVVLARSTGYKLRPLFDQYGTLVAFAFGYTVKTSGKSVQHWDIQTKDFYFNCKKGAVGWEIETYQNPTGKINIIFYQQEKAWMGVQHRAEREEMLDSKTGDINNYFSDPMAAATADVIENLKDPDGIGTLIQYCGKDSRFEYIDPPLSSETREAEKKDLKSSILEDSLTPDLSFEGMKGLSTLSGEAIRRALIIGYIKRSKNLEIYEIAVDREVQVIIAIFKFLHPDKVKLLDELVIYFEFQEPFEEDKQAKWAFIGAAYRDGVISLKTAVRLLGITDKPDEEVKQIMKEALEKAKTGNVENTKNREKEHIIAS